MDFIKLPDGQTMLKVLTRRVGFYLMASAVFMLVMVLCFTLLYHFTENLSWLDSFYFTVITTRTIGFGDIAPTTEAGKIGTVLNALVPATVFLGTSLVVLDTVMKQLEEFWRNYQMNRNTGHDIIVSDVETLEGIVGEYAATKGKFVVVSREKLDDLPEKLQSQLDNRNFLSGDASRDETLERAGVKRAGTIIIATEDDGYNLYVLVTAKSLNPGIKKVVRINHAENTSKFTSAGADSVLPAASVVGQMLSQASLHPFAHKFLVSLYTHARDPFLEDVTPGEAETGEKVRDVYKRAVAIFRAGAFLFELEGEKIEKGDIIIKVHLKDKSFREKGEEK